jgi:muconate cycloisomerase
MKITKIHGYEVVVPTHPGRVTSASYGPAVFDEAPKIIIEVHTDTGLIGLGEAYRGSGEAGLRSAFGRLAGVDLTAVCIQEPPVYDLSSNDMFAHAHPTRPHRLHEQSFFATDDYLAVQTALLDLVGKKAGLPVNMLMGGAFRTHVPVDAWMARMTPNDSADVCKRLKDLGYRGVKCKCALEDDLVERAEAIRSACGVDFKITFDPNHRFYRPGEAVPILRRLAAVGNIGCVEDPFEKSHTQWYCELRQHGFFPIAMHMRYGPALFEAIRANACDYVNLRDLPWNVRRGADLCWAAGIPTWHGSGVDLGITEAVALHTCAASKSMTLPSDLFGRTVRTHNLITNSMAVSNGTVEVPTGPGLGVQLDRDALDQYTVRTFEFKL